MDGFNGFIQKVGFYPNFEQVSRPNQAKVQKLTETDPSFLLKEGSPANTIDSSIDAVQNKNIDKVKTSQSTHNFTEVKLYNTNFGFNDSSKDFFIKVDRGAFSENKYPTDEIMRLKSYLNKLENEKIVA